jgi:hypothetical protein
VTICSTCQLNKRKTSKKFGHLPEKEAEAIPWDKMCIDLRDMGLPHQQQPYFISLFNILLKLTIIIHQHFHLLSSIVHASMRFLLEFSHHHEHQL